MQYVHYWHFNKNWYAEVTGSPSPDRVGWHNSHLVQKHWNEECLIEDSTWLTHGEIKKKLTEMYPGYTLVKDKPYHQGARWHGTKGGSREGCPQLNKAKYRIKAPIRERNVAREINTQE